MMLQLKLMETPPKRRVSKKVLASILGLTIFGLLLLGGLLWQLKAPSSLLPADSIPQNARFLPYFYFDEVPAGYQLGDVTADKETGVVLFELTHPEKPTVMLAEQSFSDKINPDDLLRDGDTVKDTAHPAAINSVEGRLVGIMIDSETATMILFNAPGDADKQDLKALLQGLKRVD
jgi:hypothetical protein